MNRQKLQWVAAIMSMAAVVLTVQRAQAEGFWEARTLKIIASFFPGGGGDTYSRLIARHLPRHVPGRPRVIVQNMPGANTLVGATYLYHRAPPDGTVVGIFTPMQALRQAIGVRGVEFESDKFNWLVAGYVGDVYTCITSAASGVKSLDDAITRKEPLIVAATGPGSSTLTWARAYKEILGANFKIVPGYPGTAGIKAAIERGEADAACWLWSATKVLNVHDTVIFSQAGLKAAPELAHIDNALDRVRTKMDREILKALLTELSLTRSFVAPPGVPMERVTLLRRAFLDTLHDPKLLEEANRMGIDVEPLPGEELQNIVADLKRLPSKVKEKIRSIME